VAGRIRSTEIIHIIGTRTRELPASNIVPQSTALPRAPYIYNMYVYTSITVTYIELHCINIICTIWCITQVAPFGSHGS
jgi:hypothetical protein